MTTINSSLYDTVLEFDPVARIPALRSIAHTALGQSIGFIRNHMREEARRVRMDDPTEDSLINSKMLSLDQRNSIDEDDRANDDTKKAMGFIVNDTPLHTAGITAAVYGNAVEDIASYSNSPWDTPMGMEQMLQFLATISNTADPEFLSLMASAIKVDIKVLEHAQELVERDERAKLIRDIPEIVSIFNSFNGNGYPDAWDDLPLLTRHQQGVKTVRGLLKAKDKMILRIMKSRRLSELASIPLIDDGITQVQAWVNDFEHQFKDELSAAIDAGRNLLTVDDVIIEHNKKAKA